MFKKVNKVMETTQVRSSMINLRVWVSAKLQIISITWKKTLEPQDNRLGNEWVPWVKSRDLQTVFITPIHLHFSVRHVKSPYVVNVPLWGHITTNFIESIEWRILIRLATWRFRNRFKKILLPRRHKFWHKYIGYGANDIWKNRSNTESRKLNTWKL